MPTPMMQEAMGMPMPDMGQGGMPAPNPLDVDTGPTRFDAPIPGESLTREPGNSPWEQPPQFTNPMTAADFLFQQLLKPSTLKGILTMLKMGVPAEALARILIFTGFTEGKWTPDIAMLLFKPVMAMIVGIGGRAGIKDMKVTIGNRSSNDVIKNLLKNKKDKMPKSVNTPASLVQALVTKPSMETV